jgi:hypothetical protein
MRVHKYGRHYPPLDHASIAEMTWTNAALGVDLFDPVIIAVDPS